MFQSFKTLLNCLFSVFDLEIYDSIKEVNFSQDVLFNISLLTTAINCPVKTSAL